MESQSVTYMQSLPETTSCHVDFRHAEIAHHLVAARCLAIRASWLEVEQRTGESLGCAAPKNGNSSAMPVPPSFGGLPAPSSLEPSRTG